MPIGFAMLAGAELGWMRTTFAIHALTVGVIGGLIIGMLTRTARGHTGRPLQASRGETVAYALVLLAIVLVAAPLAAYVPLAALSAIVMVVAINMGEWHEFAELKRYSYNYRIILLSTFLVTVLFDLTIAVELGMVLASLFFIYRMSELTKIERLPLDEEAHDPRFMYPDGTMRVATW
jgi:hypothetical protein